jgi:hypothetical protein
METSNTPFTISGEASMTENEHFEDRILYTICLFHVDGTIALPR